MEPTNHQRADRFEAMLQTYDTDDTDSGCLTDVLADARHWCDREGLSYREHDERAHTHYLEEVFAARRTL